MGLSSSFRLILLSYITLNIYTAAESHGLNLWCRYCSNFVGDTSHIFNILSPGAYKVEERYMFGKNVTVQELINPFLQKFNIITTENASCADVGHSIGGRTWFPGYAWRVCTCPRCSYQLGWTFTKELSNDIDEKVDIKKTFHVLMLRSLLGLNEDDDPGSGMLTFLKYSKPYSNSTVPPFHVRAKDDAAASKADEVSSTPRVVDKNIYDTKTEGLSETNNSTANSVDVIGTTLTPNSGNRTAEGKLPSGSGNETTVK